MTYDAQHCDGFDVYGPTTVGTGYSFSNSLATLNSLLTSGNWTNWAIAGSSIGGLTAEIGPNIGGPAGQGLRLIVSSAGPAGDAYVFKTLAASYATHIGGVAMNAASQWAGIKLVNAGKTQVTLVILSTGQLGLWRGDIEGGTFIAASSQSVPLGTNYEMEWYITIAPGTAGIAKVWLNGVLTSLNLTGINTSADGNSVFNQFGLGGGPGANALYDHLYGHLYLTAGTSDSPLLNGPVIETQFPSSDASVTWSAAASVLGEAWGLSGNTFVSASAPGANTLFLRKFVAPANMTLNSVSCFPNVTSVMANLKAVAYADSAGIPGALLSAGAQVTGTVADTELTAALGSSQALTGGTPYWIGFITDTSVALVQNLGQINSGAALASNTYSGGAPGTAPTMTFNEQDWAIWGNATGGASNFTQVDMNPPAVPVLLNEAIGPGTAFNQSSTVGNEDLFGFPALSSGTATIETVAVKVMAAVPAGGARTLSCRMKSGATDSSGSIASFALSQSFIALASFFDVDPNTSTAWTPTNLNAATSGYKIIT